MRWEYADWRLVAVVSNDARWVSIARSPYDFPFFSESRLKRAFIAKYIILMPLVVAFFILRHNETSSELMLTFVHCTRRWTVELLSSLSRIVRRQSSMASLTDVMKTTTIRGTALSPGLTAPKMLKICRTDQRVRLIRVAGDTYGKDNEEKEIYVRNVVELVPQVLRYETQWCVLRRPNLIPLITCGRMAIGIDSIGWQCHIDKHRARARSILTLLSRFHLLLFLPLFYDGVHDAGVAGALSPTGIALLLILAFLQAFKDRYPLAAALPSLQLPCRPSRAFCRRWCCAILEILVVPGARLVGHGEEVSIGLLPSFCRASASAVENYAPLLNSIVTGIAIINLYRVLIRRG